MTTTVVLMSPAVLVMNGGGFGVVQMALCLVALCPTANRVAAFYTAVNQVVALGMAAIQVAARCTAVNRMTALCPAANRIGFSVELRASALPLMFGERALAKSALGDRMPSAERTGA